MAYFKKLIPALFIIGFTLPAFGNTDSLGIKEKGGEKFIMHRVEQDQTLFSISQRYGATVEQLKSTNPQTKENLVVGEVILVPYNPDEKEGDAKYHTVKNDETLFRISQQYDVPVKQIKDWNDLASNSIEPGQRLKVGTDNDDKAGEKEENDEQEQKENRNSPDSQKHQESGKKKDRGEKGKKPDLEKVSDKDKSKKEANKKLKSPDSEYDNSDEVKSGLAKKFKEKQSSDSENRSGEMVTKNQEGKATWLSHIDSDKSLALHKSAPPGTIIKITNLVNDRVVYVKTVGKLNKNEDEATLITISPKAAEKLKVEEDFFRAELEYSYREKKN